MPGRLAGTISLDAACGASAGTARIRAEALVVLGVDCSGGIRHLKKHSGKAVYMPGTVMML